MIGFSIAAVGFGIAAYMYVRRRSEAGARVVAEQEETLLAQNDATEKKKEDIPRIFAGIQWVCATVQDAILVFGRFIVLAVIFFPVLITVPLLFIGKSKRIADSNEGMNESVRWGALLWYKLLVKQMEFAGPTFVKLGQWAGSRHDLFPDALCNMFGKLHSNNKPHSLQHTKRELERVFQLSFDQIFESFDNNPLGVGAVGQVYKAVLRDNLLPPGYLEQKPMGKRLPEPAHRIGRELALTYEHTEVEPRVPTNAVAIKVLHPNVHGLIDCDVRIMRFFANIFNALPGMKWVSLPEEVNQFAELMVSQLDLRKEASNLMRFEKNFASRGGLVTFPRPLVEFCSRNVMIEELIDAVPLKYFMNLGGDEYDKRIAALGLDAFLSMLLLDNFTHADLHPGNIMVRFYLPTTRSILQNILTRSLASFDPDYALGNGYSSGIVSDDKVVSALLERSSNKKEWLKELKNMELEGYLPEIVLIDAGLVSELSATNRHNFLDLFAAVATFDGDQTGTLLVERCRSPQLVTDKAAFVQKIAHIVNSVKSDTFSLASLHIGEALSDTLSAVRKCHVKMEPEFVDTIISILILEGIGRRLDPDLDVFRSAIPILRSLGLKVSRDDSQFRELRQQTTFKAQLSMIKLWAYMEGRNMLLSLSNSPKLVDAFVRYGWFSD
ncbi:hypothetical protein MVES1_002047 [Malassezia vespertilionis]|uniref:ABC1 atypical kinase-like domain-containing protein n=1 Tax=Malassezia vespertilionis TaxID=2020962 RepID=A0A2N1JBW1_9BASI|nr:uncharacterized protein MVES1_002047 [Malassezia vespertilionis]PKI84026.1 hypothetical protein MVES_001937 [Malassezia vespertilionis]WFD06693.1 hypothetical protein MVES1_002047 [Malassezia vespertilionis]